MLFTPPFRRRLVTRHAAADFSAIITRPMNTRLPRIAFSFAYAYCHFKRVERKHTTLDRILISSDTTMRTARPAALHYFPANEPMASISSRFIDDASHLFTRLL